MSNLLNALSVVHVRVDGYSGDVPLDALDLAPDATDEALKRALARRLELPENRLRDLIVDRHATGNLTVRPEAVFG